MNIWHQYKNFLFKSMAVSDSQIKVVIDESQKKTYFCFDDILEFCGYKKDENEAVSSFIIGRYKSRLKLINFSDVFSQSVFISIDSMKDVATAISLVSGVSSKKERAVLIVKKTLTKFIEECKNRKIEPVADKTVESYVNLGNHLFSVATHEGKRVVKATDVLRYCGYKDISVKDNIREFCVKMNTKFGEAHFIFIDSFPIIAKTMQNEKYSIKMNRLYTFFNGQNPIKDRAKLVIDKERSVMIVDAKVIPFKELDNMVYFHSTTVQKLSGYKRDKIADNFKEHSVKFEDDNYYMTVNDMSSILQTKITPEYRKNLSDIHNNLHRFSV